MQIVVARVRSARPLLGLAALIAAASGCKVNQGLRAQQPQIDVSPSSLTIEPLPVGKSSLSVLQVRNLGNSDLHFRSPPAITGTSADFTLTSLLDHDCTGAVRPGATPLTIAPGDCARVIVQYLPTSVSSSPAQVALASDDPDRPVVSVPITLGDAAKLTICALDEAGNQIACDAATGAPPTVPFGHAARGATVTRKVRLTNSGKVSLDISGVLDTDGPMKAEFKRDGSAIPAKLAAGASAVVTVTFTPSGGGVRTAWFEIDSADPVRPTVQVPLQGQGDGPALCADPSPVDFGSINVGAASDKTLTLTSCGTAPVQLQQIAFAASVPVGLFTATTTIPAPQTLAVGGKVTVGLRFRPDSPGATSGALLTPTADTPAGFVVLKGLAIDAPVCRLGASVTALDFGQVVRGQTGDRTVTLANRGKLDCHLSGMAITLGAAYFSVQNPLAAPVTLRPGDVFTFTLRYAPPASDNNNADNGIAEASSDDPVTPKLDIQLSANASAAPQCKLQVTPSSGGFPPIAGRNLQFGNVTVGHPKILPVTLKNIGSADCQLKSYKLTVLTAILGGCNNSDCMGYSIASPLPPGAIAPGQSAEVNVAFKPTDTNQISFLPTAYLDIQTSDAADIGAECVQVLPPNSNAGCVEVGLVGQGIVSTLAVLPTDLNFGLVTLGCKSKTEAISLYNTGTAPFNIKSLRVDPAVSSFYLVAPPTPFVMNAGAKVQIQVTYKPSAAAKETATLFIESDASNTTSNNPYVTVALSGTGTTDKHQVDTFQQSLRPAVDLLFVMDNSSSMQDKQAAISQQAPRFIQTALTYNADFHIGVTSTEADKTDSADSNSAYQGSSIYVGGLFGTPGIIDGTTANPADAFAKNIKVGTCCSDNRESGLESAWDVLRAPANQSAPPQGSKAFLRDEARLVILAMSDEEDQSHGTTDFYVDFLNQLKGRYNAGLVSFNSISGDAQGGCDAGGVKADAAPRYFDVDQRTGGKFWSLCTADWAKIADDLSFGAFSGRKQFALSRYADPATLAVTLNAAPEKVGSDYSYDQPSNSVVFPQAPPAGTTIVAAYDALCF